MEHAAGHVALNPALPSSSWAPHAVELLGASREALELPRGQEFVSAVLSGMDFALLGVLLESSVAMAGSVAPERQIDWKPSN